MYNVSADYRAAMARPVQRTRLTGTIAGIEFTDANIVKGSFSISNQCSDNTELKIGQVYTAELCAKFSGLNLERYTLNGVTIVVSYGLWIDAETGFEDVPLGVFIVKEAEWTAEGVSIKAYDNMSKLDKSCAVTATVGTAWQLAKQACDRCKVILGTTMTEFANFANGSRQLSMYTETDIETWRDWISWVAQTCACNAMADRSGKIIFRPYDNNVVDTIDDEHRLAGASFSDFETKYTGLSCVNIADQKTEYYGLDPDDGLTYNLGSNPLLQYGLTDTKDQMRRDVLNHIKDAIYVPFKLSMIGSPAYDLMDVFSFTDGLADSTKQFCMTKYNFKYHGTYDIEGVGKNPDLATARSKTDKNLTGLMANQDNNQMHYYTYVNVDDIDIGDGQSRQVALIRFVVNKTTHIVIDMQFLLNTDNTETNGSVFVEDDLEVKATYYLDDIEITGHNPIETYRDGKHVLRLRYDLIGTSEEIHTWAVWLDCKGGSVHIDREGVLAVIMGQGLAGESEWDGNIQCNDNILGLEFIPDFFGALSDTASVWARTPVGDVISDRVAALDFVTGILGSVTDTSKAEAPCMVFSPWVNADLVDTDITTIGPDGWIGSGSTISGTAATVKTCDMTGVKSVTTFDASAVYYVSFDSGSTWVVYTENGWQAGAAMIDTQIMAIPESAWSGHNTVMIRADIAENCTLFDINVYGASVAV